jgi:hypothetical protein
MVGGRANTHPSVHARNGDVKRTAHGRPSVSAAAVQDRRAPHPTCPYFILQLADSPLTQRLFAQIIGRIERLAWHPT